MSANQKHLREYEKIHENGESTFDNPNHSNILTLEIASKTLNNDVDTLRKNYSKSNRVEFRSEIQAALNVLHQIFDTFAGCVQIELWDGTQRRFGQTDIPDFKLIFRCPRKFAKIILRRDPLVLADAYFEDSMHIEGDMYQALSIRDHIDELNISLIVGSRIALNALLVKLATTVRANIGSKRWQKGLRQTLNLRSDKKTNRKAIAYHYDVSNDFYRLWLDRNMVYSCAYFNDENQPLEQAQTNKLDHICRKLRLKPGERLLDIGCGWGALLCWAAQHYQVKAHGITLSEQQYRYVIELIKEKGLQELVTVELKDYRDLDTPEYYDKAVSVGMFEHVGLKNLPQYFDIVNQQLKPSGLFLNHGITMESGGWKNTTGTKFINTYVFPDGQLETISTVQGEMESQAFEIHDVENLRVHYALTLREWVKRLEQHHQEALQFVDESTYRIWRLYMAACAQQFEVGSIGIYQILASKRKAFSSPVPLTRSDLYVLEGDDNKTVGEMRNLN